jgi:hypothetical protein
VGLVLSFSVFLYVSVFLFVLERDKRVGFMGCFSSFSHGVYEGGVVRVCISKSFVIGWLFSLTYKLGAIY